MSTTPDMTLTDTCPDQSAVSPIVIKASRGWIKLELADLWEYRELLYFLVWRDVKVRYKQTALGAAWAVLQPFLTMLVFALVFGRMAKVPTGNTPYPIFAFAALLPWQLFAFALTQASNSLITNEQLIKKIYFPRVIVPLAAALVGMVDFVVAFVLLIAMMFYYHVAPGRGVVLLPLLLLLAFLAALAVGLWLSALNVKYRDIRYTIPFLTQFWLFATPVAYPASLIPSRWRMILSLNPMTSVVDGFRWALLGSAPDPLGLTLMSTAAVFALLIGGLIYFRRMERSFADLV